jgi:uncharacterized protein YggE
MKRKIFTGALFLLILSCSTGFLFAEQEPKEYKEYVIRVTGTGKVYAEPDSFSLVFSVTSESVNLRRATSDNAGKIAGIVNEIKKLNIPNAEFSTSTFDFIGDKGYSFIFPSKTYKISNKVTVKAEKIQYDKLSDYASSVIDATIQNGATDVKNLSFYVEDRKTAEEKALKEALGNAKEKASLIAKELNVSLREPYNMLGAWVSVPVGREYREYNLELMRSEAPQESQVFPGKEAFTASVEVEYKFK